MSLTLGRSSLATRGALALVTGVLIALLGHLPTALASSSCPNELFRTGPGANLPDCRAYELVSPPQKNGGEVDGGPTLESGEAPQQAAADGEAITYASQTPFAEGEPLSGLLSTQYLSRRGPNGWSTQAITPEQDLPGNAFDKLQHAVDFSAYQGFNEDLSHGFLFAYEPAPAPGAPAGYYSPYLRNDATDAYELLSDAVPPVQMPGAADTNHGFWVEYAGMSTDGGHVAFAANDALTQGALPGVRGERQDRDLYEWSDGHLELVNVLPNGEAAYGVFGASDAVDQGGLSEDYERVISADGSRTIWTDTETFPVQLYMHEITATGTRNVHISASQRTDCADHSPCTGTPEPDPAGPQAANYVGASVDGGDIFFTSCEPLTNDSTAGIPGYPDTGCADAYGKTEVGEDLYRYEAATGALTDLTVDSITGQTASVLAVLGMSEDGSYVYFVAHSALVAGAPSGSGVDNIYLWHNGDTSLIASAESGSYGLYTSNFQHLDESGLSRVSPDGRYLTFESPVGLTGYDNEPTRSGECKNIAILKGEPEPNPDSEGRCIEVYEYDADAGRLICASCNPRGLPPVGNSVVPIPVHALTNPTGWQNPTVQQRYLLDDGRLFFDSTDELLPQASNTGELNVYEYEPGGVGSCQREGGGCLSLISTGASNENSYFVDASTSGNDAFLVTRQQLVAQDGDEALDLYDARVAGGFAAATPPPCGGEACRPPVTAAPAIYEAPPSATFVGPGNPPQPAVKSTGQKIKAKAKPKPKRKIKRHVRKKTAHGSHKHTSKRGSRR